MAETNTNNKYMGGEGLSSLIKLIYSEVSSLGSRIDAINGIDPSLVTQLEGLLADAEKFATAQSVTELTGRVSKNETAISTINGNISDINGKIGETAIPSTLGTTITAALVALNTELGKINAALAEVGDLDEWDGDADTITGALDELLGKINSINTLLGSSTPLQTSAQNVTGAINELKTAVDGKASTTDLNDLKKAALTKVEFGTPASDKVPVTFTYVDNTGTTQNKNAEIDLSTLKTSWMTKDTFLSDVQYNSATNKIEFTFNTADNGAKKLELLVSDFFNPYTQKNDSGTNVNVTVDNTGHTISADLDATTKANVAKISTIEDDVKTLKDTTVPGIAGRVDTLEGTVSGLETTVGKSATTGLQGRVKTLEDAGYAVTSEVESTYVAKADFLTAAEVQAIWTASFKA